ncbi:MAG: folate-binding protein YgfZ [Alphaproteobacteria bacterium]|nr:folate-binding protein YgfZ [Alphaproteobacteria bacterium]MBV9553045.1 folate-binding protein YgfZ [Alphaproteobacteria bacterium]
MNAARFVVLEDRAVLAVGGPDRSQFLQGLISNDTRRLAEGRAIYAALLTPQGKYLHDFLLVEVNQTIWIDGEAARLADLKRRLSIYRLRSRVTLEERSDLAVAALLDAAEALELPAERGAARRLGNGIAFVDPRLAVLGARAILLRQDLADAFAAIGANATCFADYDRVRLAFGIPDGSRDLVLDKSILLESGFDELGGVDWEKGCYIGQELTARTRYRGLVKKRLFPVRIEGPAPEPGSPVTAGDRDAGEMRSSRDGIGLALLRLDAVAQGGKLAAGAAKIEPVIPDWMRLPE